ncbi:MAG TPA: hypothetical protein DEO87_04540 [Lachnospiraceae bacterium]|nr:hypothetical protein [Lachnospiraceae bacterium]
MKRETKNIIKDLKAGRNLGTNVRRYSEILSTAFTNYAAVKLSLNLFTLMEMIDELPSDRRAETNRMVATLRRTLTDGFSGKAITDEDIAEVIKIREAVTARMKILTAYTDACSIYEYVLDRKKPAEDPEAALDTAGIAENMYNYVFQENDKMLINSKIQTLIAELPVRMTKDRFFDIISNTLNIYRGGEKEAVNDFIEMIKTAAVLTLPEGFETEYPELFEIYDNLTKTDVKALDANGVNVLSGEIYRATEIINSYVTDQLMLIEIINDSLTVLFTINNIDKSLLNDKYDISVKIITETLAAEDIYKAAEGFDELFVSLEGIQEDAYETLATVESSLFDICDSYSEPIETEGLTEVFAKLNKADKLTSTSLFIDLDRDIRVVSDAADEIFISDVKVDFEEAMRKKLDSLSIPVRRAVMAKVLSVLPVFFNNKEEIREYFNYALDKCSDKSELATSVDKINEIILGE